MPATITPAPSRAFGIRALAVCGALCAAAAVALSAYVAHAATDAARMPLLSAAAVAFGHGLALAALARQCTRRLAVAALWTIALGTLLFSGGIALHHLTGVQLGVAPAGGSLLILAWLAWAIDAARG